MFPFELQSFPGHQHCGNLIRKGVPLDELTLPRISVSRPSLMLPLGCQDNERTALFNLSLTWPNGFALTDC